MIFGSDQRVPSFCVLMMKATDMAEKGSLRRNLLVGGSDCVKKMCDHACSPNKKKRPSQ